VNMITPIRADESIHGSTVERAHRHAISVHCPNCDEMEMAARVDLAIMRDAATVGVGRASEHASVMLHEVSKLAAQAVYAPIATSRLLRVRAALNLTMEAARAVERALRDG
jgi:hypothetical protein